ncbi:hypothetical protein ADK82_14915 [Streptomyces sp. NRRL S-4]|nr:hypothetical protein ADK82_14915 [Streptomyces sp. NRRL S-4]
MLRGGVGTIFLRRSPFVRVWMSRGSGFIRLCWTRLCMVWGWWVGRVMCLGCRSRGRGFLFTLWVRRF